LITAFVDTIAQWSNNSEIAIGFERHGRETMGTNLDLSKTVGWLTAYFPIRFTTIQSENIKDQIVAVKEKMRSIPNGGIGYGALRYLTKAFSDIENPEIVFNFLGVKSRKISKQDIEITNLSENLRDPKSERHYKLEVNVQIIDNQLQGSLSYGNQVHDEETIVSLLNTFQQRIQAIVAHGTEESTGSYTPSDFSEIDISQDDLDSLLDVLD